jgi:hypothetical protein
VITSREIKTDDLPHQVVASREAALLYHSAAALEPSAYGVNGVREEEVGCFLEEIRLPLIATDCH